MKSEELHESAEDIEFLNQEKEDKAFVEILSTTIREIEIPFAKREELFVYLDISLDCLERSLTEEFFLDSTISNHAKERIDSYFYKNRYIDIFDVPANSFYSFSNYIFYDSGIATYNFNINAITRKIQKEMGTEVYMDKEKMLECSNRISAAHKKYKIDNLLVDPYSYIIAKKHCDTMIEFLTDRNVYEALLNDAMKEIEKNQGRFNKAILESKKIHFLSRLDKIYPLAVRESGLTTNWYVLLEEYIEKIEELFPEDKSTEQLKSKVTMYLFQSLFNHLDIDTKHESFYRLMSRITGIAYETTVKYLTDTTMCTSNDAYAKNALYAIELLEKFKVRESEYRKGQSDDPQDNLTPIICKLLKDLKSLKEMDSSNKDKIENLKKKYNI